MVEVKKILLIFVVLAVLAVMAEALASWTINFSWTVVPPKESDLKCYDLSGSLLTEINWGELEQGKTYTYSFIVKNTGSTKLKLHLNKPHSSWTEGSEGTLSWDREGYVLNPGESVTATLSWYISSIAQTGTHSGLTIGIEGYPP